MKDQSNADIVKFTRRRDYQLVRELGGGACGLTVLLYDDQINEHFVCKKFTPYSEEERSTLFSSFVRETKILHQVYHENVVRVFNYYLYPDQCTGFILMKGVKSLFDSFKKYHQERILGSNPRLHVDIGFISQ